VWSTRARRSSRGAVVWILAVAGALGAASGAMADDDGYLDNWGGDVKIELRAVGTSGPPTTFPIPVDSSVPSLRDSVAAPWQKAIAQTCAAIRARFDVEVGFSEWLTCQISTDGELRGRSSGSNTLDLKYVLKSNHILFKKRVPGNPEGQADPVLQAEFDIILRLSIVFSRNIDGRRVPAAFEMAPEPPAPGDLADAAYLDQPAKLTSAVVTFGGVRVTSQGMTAENELLAAFGGEAQLRDAERRLNAATTDAALPAIDLREINRSLHRTANRLTVLLKTTQPTLGTPTPYFGLLASIARDRNLVVRYQRFETPPAPLQSCKCSEKCDDAVACTCAGEVKTGEQVLLQREKPAGHWVTVGAAEGTSTVNGEALGAHTGDTLSHRMCRANLYGSSCGTPTGLTYTELGACPAPTPDVTTGSP
jgi:hypothetical protein